MKTFAELEAILIRHNKTFLEKQTKSELAEGAATVRIPQSSDSPCPTDGGELQAHCHCYCYCGTTTHAENARDLIARCVNLRVKTQEYVRVMVGTVLDERTRKLSEERPVVLAVGINYGQGCQYADKNKGIQLVTDTTMHSRTTRVLQSLDLIGCHSHLVFHEREPFHLVAANFFPWITSWPWGELGLNAIEEALLLKCAGHEDPVFLINELIDLIRPEIVMFHGANNIVPSLGVQVTKLAAAHLTESSVIFCDNLGPSGSKISNAVVLCKEDGREILPFIPFDE